MAQIREEIYDENGLVEVIFHQLDEPNPEELIAQKEEQLLKLYEEIQQIKQNINN